MTGEQVRSLCCATPFEPFRVHTADARSHPGERLRLRGALVDLEFSYNKTSWTLYSETGNYRDGISGSVLPTTNVGEISLSAGGQLFARQKRPGYLMSDVASFYNNTSKTPHDDGTGGGDGTPGKNLP
jgi:hypothetical protein